MNHRLIDIFNIYECWNSRGGGLMLAFSILFFSLRFLVQMHSVGCGVISIVLLHFYDGICKQHSQSGMHASPQPDFHLLTKKSVYFNSNQVFSHSFTRIPVFYYKNIIRFIRNNLTPGLDQPTNQSLPTPSWRLWGHQLHYASNATMSARWQQRSIAPTQRLTYEGPSPPFDGHTPYL